MADIAKCGKNENCKAYCETSNEDKCAEHFLKIPKKEQQALANEARAAQAKAAAAAPAQAQATTPPALTRVDDSYLDANNYRDYFTGCVRATHNGPGCRVEARELFPAELTPQDSNNDNKNPNPPPPHNWLINLSWSSGLVYRDSLGGGYSTSSDLALQNFAIGGGYAFEFGNLRLSPEFALELGLNAWNTEGDGYEEASRTAALFSGILGAGAEYCIRFSNGMGFCPGAKIGVGIFQTGNYDGNNKAGGLFSALDIRPELKVGLELGPVTISPFYRYHVFQDTLDGAGNPRVDMRLESGHQGGIEVNVHIGRALKK